MGGDSVVVVDDDASVSKDTVEVNINVRCSNGSKFSVQITLDSTIGSFKEVIAQKCDIPSDQQRLIYKGRILKDDQTLQSYGIYHRSCYFFFLSRICCDIPNHYALFALRNDLAQFCCSYLFILFWGTMKIL